MSPPPPPKKKLSVEQVRSALAQLPEAARLVHRASPSGLYALLVLALISAVVPVALLYVGKLIVDGVVNAAQGKTASDSVLPLVGLEAGLTVLNMVLARLNGLVRQRVGERLSNSINLQILEKTLTLNLSHFEDSEFYDKLTRARREAGYRPLAAVSDGVGLIQESLSLVGYVSVLAGTGWWVVGLVVVASIPSFLAELKFSAEGFELRNWQSPDSRKMMYTEYVLGSDAHVKEVQLFGLGKYFLEQYRALTSKLFNENAKLAIRRFVWGTGLGLVSSGAYYGTYAVVALSAATGKITLGDLTLYALAFRQAQGSFQAVLSSMGTMYENGLYLTNLFGFLGAPTTRGTPPPVELITPVSQEAGIRFENVSFKYPGSDKAAVSNVNLFIPGGKAVALVGNNGAGKTTFIKLLTGLYTPTSGRVLLDGKDIRGIPEDELHARFAVIFQDYNRYQLTFKDNVGLGSVPHLTNDDRIKRAVDEGGAEQVLKEMKAGMDTQLGRWFHKGTELSGGQWQKVALSRAFMRREADVLILDEPTAALDPEAEYAVFQRFKELTKGRTSIIISHRFSTVRLADQIFVLADGQLAEEGTHAELLAKKGSYARMFELQAEGYRP